MAGDSRAPRSTLDEIWILLGELLGKEPPASGEAPELFGLRRRARALLREVMRGFGGGGEPAEPLALPAPPAAPARGTPATSSDPAESASPGAKMKISSEVAGRSRRFELAPDPAHDPSREGAAEPSPDSSLEPGREAATSDIPWGYGRDRITAMAVDPDRLFVYWEITDEAIERARSGLGAGGPSAWPSLRVYDVSGRLFDGTNAHSYFDHRIERSDRQWFLFLGRPTASFVVEVGMKSLEGYFVRIARSGRVDMPRREPAPAGPVEWLTVHTSSGPLEVPRGDEAGVHGPSDADLGAAPASRGGAPGRAENGGQSAARGSEGVAAVAMPGYGDGAITDQRWVSGGGGGWLEWTWQRFHPGRLTAWLPVREWRTPVVSGAWQAGPFPLPVSPPEVVEERSTGPVQILRSAEGTRVVYGPWSVVIRGIGARVEHRVLSVWEMVRSVLTGAAAAAPAAGRPGDGATGAGGSERIWLGASEQRWMGGSEEWLMAASELRLGGASERWLASASELRLGGASEWRASGASELRLGGAGEWQSAGGSEVRLGGASEQATPGALGQTPGDPPSRVASPAAYPVATPGAGEP